MTVCENCIRFFFSLLHFVNGLNSRVCGAYSDRADAKKITNKTYLKSRKCDASTVHQYFSSFFFVLFLLHRLCKYRSMEPVKI